MSSVHVARRYAKALVAIGREDGSLDRIVQEMKSFAEAYTTSPELAQTLRHPLVPLASKKAILIDLSDRLGLGPTVRNVLQILNERRRMTVVPAIASALEQASDGEKGILRVDVTSAGPLDETFYQKLHTQLEKMTGKRVVLERRVDPELIAGVVTRIGDKVYDGSLSTRLSEMRQLLAPS